MRKLIVSGSARLGLRTINAYIIKRFGKNRATMYKKQVAEAFGLMQQFPERAPQEVVRGQAIRKAVVNSRTILLFTFDDEYVTILEVKDSRTDWLR